MCLLSHLGCHLIELLSISFLWNLVLNLLSNACTTFYRLNFEKSSDRLTELLQILLLLKQLIEPSVSPFGAPLLFVLEKSGLGETCAWSLTTALWPN